MRTTLDIDEDLLRLAKHVANERQESLGKVVSSFIRQGLQPAPAKAAVTGAIPILARKPGAQPVTSQAIRDLLEVEC